MSFKEEGGDEVKRGRLHDVRKETLFYTFVHGATEGDCALILPHIQKNK